MCDERSGCGRLSHRQTLTQDRDLVSGQNSADRISVGTGSTRISGLRCGRVCDGEVSNIGSETLGGILCCRARFNAKWADSQKWA